MFIAIFRIKVVDRVMACFYGLECRTIANIFINTEKYKENYA